MSRRAVITGAFSYTGAAVARELLGRGWTVHTLTNRKPPPDCEEVTSAPLRFEPQHLKNELAGADVFINTYWVRLPWAGQDFGTAVERSAMLIDAAKRAGVGKIVHISVSNAAKGRNLGYYRGKAEVEELVRDSGLQYSIVRPTLILGPGDVLTNNIAWFLRKFPVFPLPRGGRYRLQPVTLADTARITADQAEATENEEVDAAGPDGYSYSEYVRLLAKMIGARALFVSVPNWLALGSSRIVGWLKRDIVLTKEELLGLQQELLFSHEPPLGRESVADWLKEHGGKLGRYYANDLHRHFGAGAGVPIQNPVW